MAEDKKSFLLYADQIHTVSKLPDIEAGLLFKTILEYVNDLNPSPESILVQVAFEPIKQQLKRDLRKWDSFRKKQSENGKLGGRPKKEETQNNPNNPSLNFESQKSLNVNVNVNDIKNNTGVETPSIDFQRFIDLFNSFANRNFRVTEKVKSSLKARLKDYSKEEILKAIELAHKDQYHLETNFKYLTPEFILRPDKLEKFLNSPKMILPLNPYTRGAAN